MDKRRFWLKLEKDFLKSSKIKLIRAQKNGGDYVLLYLSLMLESIENIGHLRLNEMIAYNEDMLAAITDINVDIVRSGIKLFVSLGLINILTDGTMFLPEIPKLVANESESAERVREYRARQALQCNEKVTSGNKRALQCNEDVTNGNNQTLQCNEDVTICNENVTLVEKSKEEKIKEEKSITNARASKPELVCPKSDFLEISKPPEPLKVTETDKLQKRFLAFYKAYPKKRAPENALKAWVKLKPDDGLLQTMLAAIKVQHASTDWQKDGGQFIPYPATWLNGRRWEDEITGGTTDYRHINKTNFYNENYTVEDAIKEYHQLCEAEGVEPDKDYEAELLRG